MSTATTTKSSPYEATREQRLQETVTVPRFLCPSGHKLYDFRQEPGFKEIADLTLAEDRTLLDHNRLLSLWHSVRNVSNLSGCIAEVGSYRGGSAKFIARSSKYFDVKASLHVFDTFEGHPSTIVQGKDGTHSEGLFSDTSKEEVESYLSGDNAIVHAGDFANTCNAVSDQLFRFVHVDVDIYASTLKCLGFFWPRLVDGGIIVLDDYGFDTCKGAKEAAESFLSKVSGTTVWYLHTGQFVIQKNCLVESNEKAELSEIDVLREELMSKELELAKLSSELKEKADLLSLMQSECEQLRETLQGVYNSKGWKLIRQIRNLIPIRNK